MSRTKQYLCATCSEPVVFAGNGLKTPRCSRHPRRTVTVIRDLSGGKEVSKNLRSAAIAVHRHTKTMVIGVAHDPR